MVPVLLVTNGVYVQGRQRRPNACGRAAGAGSPGGQQESQETAGGPEGGTGGEYCVCVCGEGCGVWLGCGV